MRLPFANLLLLERLGSNSSVSALDLEQYDMESYILHQTKVDGMDAI
jgi:hypothetical protein